MVKISDIQEYVYSGSSVHQSNRAVGTFSKELNLRLEGFGNVSILCSKLGYCKSTVLDKTPEKLLEFLFLI